MFFLPKPIQKLNSFIYKKTEKHAQKTRYLPIWKFQFVDWVPKGCFRFED